jgi:hypothetical protein
MVQVTDAAKFNGLVQLNAIMRPNVSEDPR